MSTEEDRQVEFFAWTLSLDEEEREFLLAEAAREFADIQSSLATLESRVTAMVGWALLGVGTFLIASGQEDDLATLSWSSIIFIAGCAVTLLAGMLALFPRRWASGVDLAMYRRLSEGQEPSDITALKVLHFSAIAESNAANRRVLANRERLTTIALGGLLWEFASLLGVFVVALLR